ncbi:MAG: DUF3159 domain-containing protein [Frankia sp.]
MPAPDGPARPPTSVNLAEVIGGPRGIVDATVPTVAFVAVNAIAGLSTALVVAIVASVLLLALRVVRREPLQQTFSGMFGVVLAVIIARRTGSASGFFLPGIARNALFLLVGLGSMLARRPLAGYVLAAFDERYGRWRADPALRRAAYWATLLWVALFGLRVVVQGALYLADRPGWLAAANLGLGVPLYVATILATVAVVRRLAPAAAAADDQPVAAGDPDPTSTVSTAPTSAVDADGAGSSGRQSAAFAFVEPLGPPSSSAS